MDSSYTRSGLTVLSNDGSDAVSAYRTSIRNLAAWAEASAALRGQGLLSARPAAGKAGTFYKATDDVTGVLYYDNGTTWETVGASATVDGSAATPSLRTLGSGSTQAAAGNHTHALAAITGTGDAAAKNTGTTSGTVAAGDHTHSGGVTALYVRKNTATNRVSTATLADDPDLTLTLAASGTYRLQCNIVFACNGNPPGLRMNFGFGTGVTRRAWMMIGSDTSAVMRIGAQYSASNDITTIGNGTFGDNYGYFSHDLILTTGSSGTFSVTFRWSQVTSNVQGISVYDGSYMLAEKIA